jgi:DNA-directed RNA polymerase specialized sigma24 family protein
LLLKIAKIIFVRYRLTKTYLLQLYTIFVRLYSVTNFFLVKQFNNAYTALSTGPPSVHEIYNRYAGLLLGYITEVVNDRQLAETCLVEVFKQVARFGEEVTGAGENTWLQLRQMAKKILNEHRQQPANVLGEIRDIQEFQNKFLTLMNAKQKQVFCAVYYDQKSIADVAQELNKPVPEVKAILREAFNVIKHGQ